MVTAASLALLALSLGGLEARGGATCPTPGEIAERARPLLASDRASVPELVLEVEDVAPNGLRAEIDVRLRHSGQAAPLAQRRLARTGSCGELAETAAVVVASWAGQYDTPAPDSLPLPDGDVNATLKRRATAQARPDALDWDVGTGGGAVIAADGGAAPVGTLELTARRPGARWFVRLGLSGSGERQASVATGAAGWRRLLVMPSGGRTWGDSVFVEASAGPVVGPVFVRGQGFSTNATDVGVDVGLSPTLRIGVRLGEASRTSLWLGGSAVGWLRPHELTVDMSSARAVVPRVDLFAGAGLSYVLAPR